MTAKSQRIRAWAVAQAKKEREEALLEQVTACLEGTSPQTAPEKLFEDLDHALDAALYAYLTAARLTGKTATP